jgi:anti-sigma factor RsiW
MVPPNARETHPKPKKTVEKPYGEPKPEAKKKPKKPYRDPKTKAKEGRKSRRPVKRNVVEAPSRPGNVGQAEGREELANRGCRLFHRRTCQTASCVRTVTVVPIVGRSEVRSAMPLSSETAGDLTVPAPSATVGQPGLYNEIPYSIPQFRLLQHVGQLYVR